MQEVLHPPPAPTPTFVSYYQNRQHQIDEDTRQKIIVSLAEAAGTTQAAKPQAEAQQDSEELELYTRRTPVYSAAQMPRETTLAAQDLIIGGDETTAKQSEERVLDQISQDSRQAVSSASYAYVQLLSSPAQICSALLFFRTQVKHNGDDFHRVIIYPSFWEADTSWEPYRSALNLLLSLKEEYKLEYYAVNVDELSTTEADTERTLLAYLTTHDWRFDRMLYLRTPGIVVNVPMLNSALYDSSDTALPSKSWTRIAPELFATTPSILLMTGTDHGVYVPRGRNRRLITEAFAIDDESNIKESSRNGAENAAYIHIEDSELEHRRALASWPNSVFQRYDQDRTELCDGFALQGGRSELRRARKG